MMVECTILELMRIQIGKISFVTNFCVISNSSLI